MGLALGSLRFRGVGLGIPRHSPRNLWFPSTGIDIFLDHAALLMIFIFSSKSINIIALASVNKCRSDGHVMSGSRHFTCLLIGHDYFRVFDGSLHSKAYRKELRSAESNLGLSNVTAFRTHDRR